MKLRRQLRRLPSLAWRDQRIEELRHREHDLRAEVRRLKQALRDRERDLAAQRTSAKYSPAHPSWHWRVQEQARVGRRTSLLDPNLQHPRRRLLQKLHNYELARSYGIATPTVLGTWARIDDVAWDTLPDRFVLKSNRGYSGRGVFPLERVGEQLRLVGTDHVVTAGDLAEHFRSTRGLKSPYFAEQMLPGTGAVLPDDVKIYAFYGEVADVLLRRVRRPGSVEAVSYRFVDADGADLGQVQENHAHDPDISIPRDLVHMVGAARLLSRAVPVPFVRVDLYQTTEGIVLGELTPLPGSSDSFTQEHDRYLGALYDDAEGRLNLDLARGRPYEVTFGSHARDLTLPMSPTTELPG